MIIIKKQKKIESVIIPIIFVKLFPQLKAQIKVILPEI